MGIFFKSCETAFYKRVLIYCTLNVNHVTQDRKKGYMNKINRRFLNVSLA